MYSEVVHAMVALPRVNLSWWHQLHHYVPIGVVGALSWSVWLSRFTLSRIYRPVPPGYTATTSVVVPSFREDPDILERCLDSWLAENPSEVIVVPDLGGRERDQAIGGARSGRAEADGHPLRAPGQAFCPRSRHPGRPARRSWCSADSDTMWLPGLLAAVLAPFSDPEVGGVGTRQNVYQPHGSAWRRVADWMIDVRYKDYVRAQARAGAVACLSGRTAAYRRSVVIPVLEHLEDEFFLGRRCVSGDDGRLTWLVLASGYKTVYQSTARALSMFPDTYRAFLKQRLRWSRNSYRTYLTAIWKGWLWRQPFICQLSVLQIMFTPLTMGFAVTYLIAWVLHPTPVIAALAVSWLVAGRALRGISHLRERPGDIWLLPLVAGMTIVVALPVKTYAFLTMNVHGWLTRSADQLSLGGEAQSASSLN